VEDAKDVNAMRGRIYEDLFWIRIKHAVAMVVGIIDKA